MSEKIVRIGGATAFMSDSPMGTAQFLAEENPPKYIVFDMLAETVMNMLSREEAADHSKGFATTFVNNHVAPYLHEVMAKGIKLIANAGGVNPKGCAEAIRKVAADKGLNPRIAIVEGDDLRGRIEEIRSGNYTEMFTGEPVNALMDGADKVVSVAAYIGAFPIAQALAAGADIVVTGRAVDSAAALGALIHEFGWKPDDYDRIASGAAVGHLVECSTQATGGTFTDWEDVPGWENIGYPIAECRADGSFVMTKPKGTGGLVSPGTCAEQLIYEVSDPQAYFVPDVVCDFTQMTFTQVGPDRVEVKNVKGRARTSTYKVSMTFDRGWRATVSFPIIGRDAVRKAERTGETFLERTRHMLRAANLAEWTTTKVEPLGGEASFGKYASAAARATREVICRITVDHPDVAGATLFMRETPGITTSMSVGTSILIGAQVRPVTVTSGFLIPKALVPLTVTIDGKTVPAEVPTDGAIREEAAPPLPAAPAETDGGTVPLIALAYGRSGDKGGLFNVGLIARKPEYLPFIDAGMSDEVLADHYAHLFRDGGKPRIDRYSAPGFDAVNYVVNGGMEGGMFACQMVDAGAKGMAQLLMDVPIPISRALAETPELRDFVEEMAA